MLATYILSNGKSSWPIALRLVENRLQAGRGPWEAEGEDRERHRKRKLMLKESKGLLYTVRGHAPTIFKVTRVGLGLGWLPGNILSSTEGCSLVTRTPLRLP